MFWLHLDDSKGYLYKDPEGLIQMAISKIPDNLMPVILAKNGEGWDCTRLAAWLWDEHQIQISDTAIRKRLTKIRDERKLMSSVIIHDKLSQVLGADLVKVEGIIQRALDDELRSRARAWGFKFHDKKEPYGLKEGEVAAVVGSETWTRLMTAVKGSRNDLMSALEFRLKLAGIDKDGKPQADTKVVRDQLMSKIDSLLEKYTPKNSDGTADPVSGLVH